MNKPYQIPVTKVFPDVKVPEPKISRFVIFIIKIVCKFYIYFLFGSAKVIVQGDQKFIHAYKEALSKETRCMIAFRHPDGREPQLLMWYIMFKLKSLAAKYKIKFPIKPHAIFIYGYEVVRWGGPFARYFMPNVGAIPIHHTKLDSKGMARINNAIACGPYPVSLAPEGQVSYSADTIPRLETGAARLGFQAALHLKEKNEKAQVKILPLSIHFRYNSGGKRAMQKLVKKIEKVCGFLHKNTRTLDLQTRLKQCRDYIIKINEVRYNIKSDDTNSFEQRLDAVVNAALETAERMLGIKPEGDFFPRLYKVRHLCWDKIYLPEIENLKGFSYLERSIKNMAAGEAWHIARHQELADFAWYFKHELPQEESPLHKTVEYVQNLWDFANRTMGGAISRRVNLHPCKIIINAADTINLSDYIEEYKEDRKTAINKVNLELKKAYINCINEVNAVRFEGTL